MYRTGSIPELCLSVSIPKHLSWSSGAEHAVRHCEVSHYFGSLCPIIVQVLQILFPCKSMSLVHLALLTLSFILFAWSNWPVSFSQFFSLPFFLNVSLRFFLPSTVLSLPSTRLTHTSSGHWHLDCHTLVWSPPSVMTHSEALCCWVGW